MIVRRSTYLDAVNQRELAEVAHARLYLDNIDLKNRLATLHQVNDGLTAQVDALKGELARMVDDAHAEGLERISAGFEAEQDDDTDRTLLAVWREVASEAGPGWSAVSNPCTDCGRPMHASIAHWCLVPVPRGPRLPHTCGPGGIGDTCAACGVEDDARHVRLEDR